MSQNLWQEMVIKCSKIPSDLEFSDFLICKSDCVMTTHPSTPCFSKYEDSSWAQLRNSITVDI